MKISRKQLIGAGNESLALGCVVGLASASCPCPYCFWAAGLFFANSLREKLAIK
ncbi:MAG: hypothetical protein QW275_02280 [Candidatus Anstonellaceae archaeon]